MQTIASVLRVRLLKTLRRRTTVEFSFPFPLKMRHVNVSAVKCTVSRCYVTKDKWDFFVGRGGMMNSFLSNKANVFLVFAGIGGGYLTMVAGVATKTCLRLCAFALRYLVCQDCMFWQKHILRFYKYFSGLVCVCVFVIFTFFFLSSREVCFAFYAYGFSCMIIICRLRAARNIIHPIYSHISERGNIQINNHISIFNMVYSDAW